MAGTKLVVPTSWVGILLYLNVNKGLTGSVSTMDDR